MRIEDNLRAGMSASEARRNAPVQFGDRTSLKENIVAIDSTLRIEQILRDLPYAFRQLARNPLFAATVISTIALGIGATIGVFSIALASWLPAPGRLGRPNAGAAKRMRETIQCRC
jgi:putative ABC transport system permease protein